MAIIEDFAKKQSEGTEIEEREKAKRAKEPSMGEILANEEDQGFFGMYLDEAGDVELASKLKAGELDAESMALLAEKRRRFLDMKEQAETLQKNIGGDLEGMIEASPDLQKMADAVGVEGLRRVLVGRTKELAFRNPEWMEALSVGFKKKAETEAKISENNERLAALCNEYGITQEEYVEALKGQESYRYSLEDLVKSKTSKIKSIFMSAEKMGYKVEDLDKRDTIKEKIQMINGDRKALGTLLHETLFKDPETHKALMAHLLSEAAPKRQDESFKDARERMKKSDFSEQQVTTFQTEWDSYKSEHFGDKGFDVDREYSSFIGRSAEKVHGKNNKKGFWASVFTVLMGKKLEQKIKK